ncbi:MAG: C1 family peptidase [Candidatus Zixiibacteriota bacterium]
MFLLWLSPIKKSRFRLVVISLLLVTIVPGFASAQLTKENIASLAQQGEKEGWTFTVGENGATGYSPEQLCGLKRPLDWQSGSDFQVFSEKADLPSAFNWRDLGACPPVKDQGGCGACWAFATIGVMECKIKIVDDLMVDLSEQWLLCCNRISYDCTGGWFAYEYFQYMTDSCGEIGGVMEIDKPYLAYKTICGCPHDRYFFIDGWAYVGDGVAVPSPEELKQAIYTYGPVSVAIRTSSALYAYNGGIFNHDEPGEVDHAVVIVGWDDSQGTEGVWIVRNSWGEGWGEEGGYMRIEYGVSSVGLGACFVRYGGSRKLVFDYPDGVPLAVYPEESTLVDVSVSGVFGGSPVPGSARLHYSVNDSDFVEQAMTVLAPNDYRAEIPALACEDDIRFYFSALEDSGASYYSPDTLYSFSPEVASDEFLIFVDSFQTNWGWSAGGDATAGGWVRTAPDAGGDDGSPVSDFDGSGLCCLTGAGDSTDVDSGTTTLTSPLMNLSGLETIIGYARWFNCGSDKIADDYFRVYISGDSGSSWVPVETVHPYDYQARGGWYRRFFRTSDFITPSDNVFVRFEVSDQHESSQVEAAVDAFQITNYGCLVFDCGDVNCSGDAPDIADITRMIDFLYLSHAPLCNPKAADVNNSGGEPDISDITTIIGHLYIDGRVLNCPR